MARTVSGRMIDVTEHMKKCVQEDREVLRAIANLDRPSSLAKPKN